MNTHVKCSSSEFRGQVQTPEDALYLHLCVMGTKQKLPYGMSLFVAAPWLNYWCSELLLGISRRLVKCGGFEGNEPQNFVPVGGLIPEECLLERHPLCPSLLGCTERGTLELSPGEGGLRKGWDAANPLCWLMEH